MGDFGALRELLPLWLGGVQPLVWIGSAFLSTALAMRLAIAGVLPRDPGPGCHWTERARRAHPARLFAGFGSGCAAGAFASVASMQAGPLSWLPAWVLAVAVFVAALLGGAWGCRGPLTRATGRPVRLFSGARSLGAWLIVFWTLPLVIVLMIATIGPEPSAGAAAGLLLGVLGFASLARGGSLRLARWLGVAREAGPRLRELVDAAAARVRVRPSVVYEVDVAMANAVAFPLGGALAFTTPALENLDDDEVEGIALHELGHLAEPGRVKWVRLLYALAYFPLGLVRPAAAALGTPGMLLIYLPLLLVLFLVPRALRKLEQRADGFAHAHQGDSPAYARALSKLAELNLTPAVMRGGSHPSLYDRLLAAGYSPDYPRPRPPSLARIGLGAGLAVLFAALLPWLTLSLPNLSDGLLRDPQQAALARSALRGGERQTLMRLVDAVAGMGSDAEARELSMALREAAPAHHGVVAQDARLAASAGHCTEARLGLDLAVALASPGHAEDCTRIAAARTQLEALCSPSPPARKRGPRLE